jgi:excisionase family DNA binding protein
VSEILLTCHEVGRLLRLSGPTVRQLLRRGDLAAVKLGAQWRIRLSAVNDLLSGNKGHGGGREGSGESESSATTENAA